MSIEVKLPNLGEGIESGDILDVKVSEGDVIAKNQSLLELETGKATVDVPSSHAGKVVKIHVAKGQTVQVGAVLISLEGSAASNASSGGASSGGASSGGGATASTAGASGSGSAASLPTPGMSAPNSNVPSTSSFPARVPDRPVSAPGLVSAVAATGGAMESGLENPAAGPAVRRFAREAGIDLSRVRGTGLGGRITREDVLEAVRHGGAAATVSPPLPSTDPPRAAAENGNTAPTPLPSVTVNRVASPADTTLPTAESEHPFAKWGPIRLQPMSRIRQTIAAKMHESWTSVPRVTNFDDADVTELERLRQASKKDYEKSGIKLTSLPFVIKAVAMALKDHPLLNASVDMERQQIIYKDYVNIGIAVDTERGLVVPSLRAAHEKSIADIARTLATISEQARENSFSSDDLRGSTFTISNLGAIGGTYSTPIVNTPEVAILLVGRSRKQAVVIDDQVQVRLMMPLSLSYDHRLVDGAAAARFLNEVIEYVAAPGRLLLAP